MAHRGEAHDEAHLVVPYDPAWAVEGAALVAGLTALVPGVLDVHHVGSTSVTGLAGRDCLDLMVRVDDPRSAELRLLLAEGFEERIDRTCCQQQVEGVRCRLRLFTGRPAGRQVEVHVRSAHGPDVRDALLFRDFLRADPDARDQWGEFKMRLDATSVAAADYDAVVRCARPLLMTQAASWARRAGWWAP